MTDVARTGQELVLTIETPARLEGCGVCGVVAVSHGRRVRVLHDIPCAGVPVRIRWRRRTWSCPDPGVRGRDAHRGPGHARHVAGPADQQDLSGSDCGRAVPHLYTRERRSRHATRTATRHPAADGDLADPSDPHPSSTRSGVAGTGPRPTPGGTPVGSCTARRTDLRAGLAAVFSGCSCRWRGTGEGVGWVATTPPVPGVARRGARGARGCRGR
jgi:hypothetical protein